jgi:signal transduction histidine kinase
MTSRNNINIEERIERLLPILVLIILVCYAYAYVVVAPYPGFSFDLNSGKVEKVYIREGGSNEIKVGDRLVQVGSVSLEAAQQNKRLQLFGSIEPGQTVPITLVREGNQLTIHWVFAGLTPEAIRDRLMTQWWIGFIFFIFGTATLLFMRPRDTRWRVMIAFNFLSALWIVIGISSPWAVWDSAILYRMVLWVALPVYVHVHWVIPGRQGGAPTWAVVLGYGAGLMLAYLQWFEAIPPDGIYLGFLVTAALCMGLLLTHYYRRPEARAILGLMVIVVGIALTPLALTSLLQLINVDVPIASFALIGLPALPAMYSYAIFRYRLGNSELRANRLLSLYLFLVVLISLLLVIIAGYNQLFSLDGYEVVLVTILPAITALLVAIFYPRFQEWIDRRLLGISLSRGQILETYSSRISASLERDQLVHLLVNEVLPSLMIRQSVLIGYDDIGKAITTLQTGLSEDFQVDDECLETLWKSAGQYYEVYPGAEKCKEIDWVHLALPLIVSGRRAGLWLLGRRDPDDFYSLAEIPMLQALANQTGIAMLNLAQGERLSLLYREDIDRQEAERMQLALELHDGVLSQLAILNLTIDEHSPAFEEAYQQATARIRDIISGLRPTMLNYGLRTALDELADEMPEQVDGGQVIEVRLPPSEVRYPPQEELHLYRIIQEACKNALLHAQAQTIRIYGSLEADCFDLTVADDGIGLPRGSKVHLDELLAGKHFGLAGMIERAHLIGAQIGIESGKGKGTRVRVYKNVGKKS